MKIGIDAIESRLFSSRIFLDSFETMKKNFSFAANYASVSIAQNLILCRRQRGEEVLQFHREGGGCGEAHVLRLCQRQISRGDHTHHRPGIRFSVQAVPGDVRQGPGNATTLHGDAAKN